MNVVITGGNGFLGSRLAEKFVSKNHNVTILDINKKPIDNVVNVLSMKSPLFCLFSQDNKLIYLFPSCSGRLMCHHRLALVLLEKPLCIGFVL